MKEKKFIWQKNQKMSQTNEELMENEKNRRN